LGRPRAGRDRRGTPEGYVARRGRARAPSQRGNHRLSSSSWRVTFFSLPLVGVSGARAIGPPAPTKSRAHLSSALRSPSL
jgi:hypothetical protein